MNNSTKIYREAVEEAGKLGDVLFWMRAGGIKSKHHQVMSWAGDQTVDWTKSDGLPSSIVAALSLAVSGNTNSYMISIIWCPLNPFFIPQIIN